MAGSKDSTNTTKTIPGPRHVGMGSNSSETLTVGRWELAEHHKSGLIQMIKIKINSKTSLAGIYISVGVF